MVTVSDEMHEQIENYRFENRCRSQTDAINQLIERGLEALNITGIQKEKPAMNDGLDLNESELIGIYRDLNNIGQKALMGTARGLYVNPDMKKGAGSNTETA